MNLYSHLWKSYIRNERWRRNLLAKILFGILMLYFIVLFLVLGLNIGKILGQMGGDPVDRFNSIILWYLPADLFMRCLLQPLPTIEVLPYLRLPLRRRQIINYLLSRSLVNLFNLIPWFVIIPFSIQMLLPQTGTGLVVIYLAVMALLLIFNNFLAVFIGFQIQKRPILYAIPFGLQAILISLNNWGIPVSGLSVSFGKYILAGNPVLIVTLTFAIIGIIYATSRLLFRNFYVDEIKSTKERKTYFALVGENNFKSLGEIGRYLSLEINLLIRNKRPRQMMVMVPIVIIYFMFILSNSNHPNGPFFNLLITTTLIGIGANNYGQFIFTWESSYFDTLMARKNNFKNYVKAKFYLLSALSILSFIPLFIFFLYMQTIDPYLICSVLLFTVGINSFIILFFSSFNEGRIDLSRSSFFNYQGINGSKYLISLVFYFLPIGIFSLFKYYFNPLVGELAIAIPGLLFIALNDWWIKRIILPQFQRRKYKNLDGYRNLSL